MTTKQIHLDTLAQTGYRVLKSAVDTESLERINKKTSLLAPHRAHGLDHKYYPKSKLSECTDLGIWWSQQVSGWPEVIEISNTLIRTLDGVFDRPSVYVADVITNEPGNTFVKPHIDSPYRFDKWWNSEELLGVQCIIPLCDFTQENGGTGLLPGSHTRSWVVKDSYAGKYNEEFLAGVVQPEMSLGDVLIYHPKTLHSTMPNLTSIPRRALLVHITSEHMVTQLRQVDNIWLE
jgi:ectoine hydroxylase-related dioxygenase (phytanoyl-CoA dioxygenase family)